jgi:hypothetical protein
MDFDLSTVILGIAALLFVVALLVLTAWAFKAIFGQDDAGGTKKGRNDGCPWSRRPRSTPTVSSVSCGGTMWSTSSLSAAPSTLSSKRESKAAPRRSNRLSAMWLSQKPPQGPRRKWANPRARNDISY